MASEWQQSAIDRRDFRNDPDPVFLAPSKRKSTKKWCKGKMGITHNYVVVIDQNAFLPSYRYTQSECTKCGKKDVQFTEIKLEML